VAGWGIRAAEQGVTALKQPLSRIAALAAGAFALTCAAPAFAQDDENDDGPVRVRIGLGPHAYPSFPGSDEFDWTPLIKFDRQRGDEPFEFGAPDDSLGVALIENGGFSLGPVVNFEGTRDEDDAGVPLPKVDFSVEPGAFVSFNVSDSFRLRGELRKGITGHKGWIGMAGADYVARDGDAWLFSIGPRVTWSNNRYQDVWFGITQEASLISGLPVYDPGSGIQAYGATASFLAQFDEHWGIFVSAKYDRLTGDAADSPLVRQYGSRDQFGGGVALTYTFHTGIFD
jgi:MipA family protein